MSHSTAKLKKPTVKVTASSRLNVNARIANASISGMNRLNQSVINRSGVGSMSRRSVSLQGDCKTLDKSALQTTKQVAQVFDENGKDVTPQPLFHPDPSAVQSKQSKIFSSQETSANASDFLSTISVYQTGVNASFAGPFTRSVFGSSTVSRSSQSTMESMNEEIEDPGSKRDVTISLSDVQVRREEVQEQLTEEVLSSIVDRCLTETETIWLLDMPSVMVSLDSEEAETIKEKNSRYEEVCKNRAGNDQYVERMMQTFNGAPKTKEVQCDKINMVDAAVMATTWDMYDTFNTSTAEGEPIKALETDKSVRPESVSSHRLDASRAPERAMSIISTTSITSCSSSGMDIESAVLPMMPTEDELDSELILQSEKFQQDLFVMERILMENIFQPKLAAYRQLPILIDPDCIREEEGVIEGDKEEVTAVETSAPALDRLWSFTCDLTKGRNVSSMAWNKKNTDLLAVGYGQFDFRDQKSGLVCCWSLKNPMWPERIFHCESGVTALDFSANSANLLAVGMHDGSIAIYSVQSKDKTPVIDSSDCANKHASPVWQVKWIEQEKGTTGEDKGETLISVSADGRITKWYLRKGLDCIDLIKLKRTRNEKVKKPAGEKERKSEALISRQAPGLCFDFHPKARGPIYKIAWSPFCPDVFLSCSADWTIHLWRQDLFKPVLGFASTYRAVFDIMWSPKLATVFGAVNEGRVEIWNLGSSILDPIAVSSASPGIKLTSFLFASETDCILVGDSDGQVSVYEMKNLPTGNSTQVDLN
ncbi:WDR78 protein, partial [Atractosteus spatula]|nr:WDR78 protein [Atractosteus spatula]